MREADAIAEATAPESPFSLRRRLMLRLLIPLVALVTVSGFASYAFALHYSNSVYDDWLYDSANSLALAVQGNPSGATLELSASARRLFEWDVVDTTYFKVSGSRSGLIGGEAGLSDGDSSATNLRDAKVFNSSFQGKALRIVDLPLPENRFGELISVEVAETKNKRLALAREILISTLLPQAILIAVAGILIWLGIRRGLAPLNEVAMRINAQSHQSLIPIADSGVPDEVRPLTRALNNLLSRLDTALAAQRRFIADAAHQLRTPLTGLRLNIEQALEETTIEDVRPILDQLRLSTERAARLSNQLLALARAEPGAGPSSNFIDFDLVGLAQEVGAEWVPRALGKNLDLSFSGPSGMPKVWGDPVLIREALNNLLDNAVKYHSGGGTIALRVTQDPRPSVEVSDDGRGIPVEQHKDMFRRFARGDRNQNVEGSGLGLAIVREIAHAHGGEVSLSEGPHGKGLRVLIELKPVVG